MGGEKGERERMEEKRGIMRECMKKVEKELVDKMRNRIRKGLGGGENIDIRVVWNVMCMRSWRVYGKVKGVRGM